MVAKGDELLAEGISGWKPGMPGESDGDAATAGKLPDCCGCWLEFAFALAFVGELSCE